MRLDNKLAEILLYSLCWRQS